MIDAGQAAGNFQWAGIGDQLLLAGKYKDAWFSSLFRDALNQDY